MGRKTRTIPPAIRRALNTRDAGCCFPGCTSTRYLDAHHVEHWADGGETKLSNLVSLCRRHHRAVHEGGIMLEAREGGGFCFKRPDGREFDRVRPMTPTPYEWYLLPDTHEASGLAIDADTASTRWRGERLDYDLAIPILCAQAQRDVSAATSDESFEEDFEENTEEDSTSPLRLRPGCRGNSLMSAASMRKNSRKPKSRRRSKCYTGTTRLPAIFISTVGSRIQDRRNIYGGT